MGLVDARVDHGHRDALAQKSLFIGGHGAGFLQVPLIVLVICVVWNKESGFGVVKELDNIVGLNVGHKLLWNVLHLGEIVHNKKVAEGIIGVFIAHGSRQRHIVAQSDDVSVKGGGLLRAPLCGGGEGKKLKEQRKAQ